MGTGFPRASGDRPDMTDYADFLRQVPPRERG